MPIYTWECESCKKQLDILRDFSESSDPPNQEDKDYPHLDECKHEKWRKILHRFHLTRGSNWKGQKGSWIQLFGIIGSSVLWKYLGM